MAIILLPICVKFKGTECTDNSQFITDYNFWLFVQKENSPAQLRD
jgi:hypothetical protein